jgi:aryl-alcohol dehydrogenase-like predicted oxidoreductase/ribosomal protein S18 acetylase RimI-like enzyme
MKCIFKQILSHFFISVFSIYPLIAFTWEEKSMMHDDFQSNPERENYPLARELGLTGIKIKPIGFGAGQLSIGEYTDESQAIAIINEAMNVYDMIDTADSYCLNSTDTGHNERLIAKAFHNHPRKDQIIIATKGGLIRRDLYNVDFDITPQHLRDAVASSLERLGINSISLYYLHAPDLRPNAKPNSFETAIQTLAELRREGKIKHIGISNVTLEQIMAAQKIVPITAVQNRLSFFDREDLENGVVDYCLKSGISYVAYSPLRGRDRHSSISQDQKLLEYAKEQNIKDPYQAALFWLLQQSPNIIPIPAARKMENLISSSSVLRATENAFLIQQALQRENEHFFSPLSMRLDFLKNCPQVIPILVQWLYEEWKPYDASLTKEKLIHSFKMRLNNHAIPITFVVLKDGLPLGVISLKKETAPEFADFPENSIWMGSLQVIPEERNQGIGQELLRFSQTIARQFGYEKLYFYTSNPANVKWYLKRGAQVIEERPFRHHKITIMEISLKN